MKILWENIEPNCRPNFDQHLTDGEDIGPYDYQSIMHYGEYDFSSNGLPTIQALHGEPIGQRVALSEGDIAAVDAMYWTLEDVNVKDFALYGTRLGVLLNDGNVKVKEGDAHAVFQWEHNVAQQFQLHGNRIGVLLEDGNLLVKEGNLDAGWVLEHNVVRQFQLEGNRIGVLLEDGNLLVKEGNLDAGWVLEHNVVRQFQLDRNRIGVLLEDGNLLVKEGNLDAGWVLEHNVVRQFQLEGNRIGVLLEDGNLLVKEGNLDAGWVLEHNAVKGFQLASRRIGVLLENGNLLVKEGDLHQEWQWEHNIVRQFHLSPEWKYSIRNVPMGYPSNRIGIVLEDNSFVVKQGSLDDRWVFQRTGVLKCQVTLNRVGILHTNGFMRATDLRVA